MQRKRETINSATIDIRNLTPTGQQVLDTTLTARRQGIDTILWYAAVRSGKTVSILISMVLQAYTLYCQGTQGRSLYVLASSSQDNVTNNMLPVLEGICKAMGIKYKDSRGSNAKVYVGNFAEFIVFGGMKKDSFATLQGNTVTSAFIDEATLLERSIIETAYQRLSCDDSILFLAMNADSPHHWIKKTYIDNPPDNVRIFTSLYDENPHLPQRRKEALSNMDDRGLLYNRNIKNEWVSLTGVVYPLSSEELVTLNEDLPVHYVGVDVGNVTAAVGLHKDTIGNGQNYVVNEYYSSRMETGEIKTQGQHADDIIDTFGKKPIYIVDPSNPTMKQELLKRGVVALKGINKVTEGIGLVSDRLFNGKLKIVEDKCPRLLEEMASYSWSEEETDKPIKKGDHACDALRYVAMTALSPFYTL